MGIARLVRGAFLSLREMEFVEAARSLGLSNRRIIMRHILPNAVSPVIVAATLGIAGAIIAESGLSYLGFGVQPPTPTWGNMLNSAHTNYWGSGCGGNQWDWCSEWGMGGRSLALMPGEANSGESYANGWSNGQNWTVTVRYGPNRMSACGF